VRRAWTWWVAWGVLALTVTFYATGITLQELAGDAAAEGQDSWATKIGLLIAFLGFATVGALVAARQPRNAVGWIFLAIGFLVSISLASGEYANRAFVVDSGSLPGGVVAGWFYMWAWFPAIGLIALLPLLFPDGRLPGRRWRVVLWGLTTLLVVMTVATWFVPGPMNGEDGSAWPDNPLGIDAVDDLYNATNNVPTIAFLVLLVASLASMVVRFRRSRGDERQQLKWMLFAVLVLTVSIGITEAFGVDTGDLVFAVTIALFPAALGVAMLKYRLYDVDVVIRKTIVYGVLSAVLAATYVGVVVGAQAALDPVTGGSNLAIAVSTLVVAALFLPVRSRVQGVVDRRFYRRRYDAQATLASFGVRLRDEVELNVLSADLRSVVAETMQPANVSLWLREPAR
jgi:hypothetical protein